jgi:hypothetical protein
MTAKLAALRLLVLLWMLASTTGCRSVAGSLMGKMLGGSSTRATRGDINESGISRKERQSRIEEIRIREATSDPNWDWSPGT